MPTGNRPGRPTVEETLRPRNRHPIQRISDLRVEINSACEEIIELGLGTLQQSEDTDRKMAIQHLSTRSGELISVCINLLAASNNVQSFKVQT